MPHKLSRNSLFSQTHSPVVKGYALVILRLADALDEAIGDYLKRAKQQGLEGESLRAIKDIAEKHSEQLEVFFCKPAITKLDCLDLLQVMRDDQANVESLTKQLEAVSYKR